MASTGGSLRATGQVITDETSGVVRTGSTELIPQGGGAPVTSISTGDLVEIHAILPLSYIYDNWPESIEPVADDTYMYSTLFNSWLEFSDKSAVVPNDIYFNEKTRFHVDITYTKVNPGTGQQLLLSLSNKNPASSLNLRPLTESYIMPGGSTIDPGRKRFNFAMTMDELSHSTNGYGGGYVFTVAHDGGGLTDMAATVEIER